MNVERKPVDVLPILVKLASFGGAVMSRFNLPRATSTVRSHLRGVTTAQVLAALRKAERAGDVECCANPRPGWKQNAADRAEHYWRISDRTLENIDLHGGSA